MLGPSATTRLLVTACLLSCTKGLPSPGEPDPTTAPPGSLGAGYVDASGALQDVPQLAFKADPAVAAPPDTSYAVFVDFNGDGVQEVVASGNALMALDQIRTAVFQYDADAQALVVHPTITLPDGFGFKAILDLDGDGRLDALTGRRKTEVAWGTGPGKFDAPKSIEQDGSTGTVMVSQPAWWPYDADDDGWLDLFTGDDRKVFVNEGGRRFRARPELVTEPQLPINYSHLVYRDSGRNLFLLNVGWSNFLDTRFLLAAGAPGPDGFPVFAPKPPPDVPWIGNDDLTLHSPMGAAIGDYDGDGEVDMLTGLSPQLALWLGRPGGGFEDASTTVAGHIVLSRDRQRATFPWAISLIDLDRDARPDLFVARGDHQGPTWPDPSVLAGEHRNSVFLLHGDSAVDATDAAGFSLPRHALALAIADLEGDGDPDMLNGFFVENPRLYRNEFEAGRRSIGLKFEGTTSNPLGIGARVRVKANGHEWLQVVGNSASPDSWSHPMVFCGLGEATVAERVTIEWPSGTRQVLSGLEGSRTHVIREPPVLQVEPTSRRVPRVTGRVTVRVTPRDDTGAVRAASSVTLRVSAGAGVVIGPATRDGDDHLFEIEASGSPGSTVLEATIDGTAVTVRPRVFWE